MKSTELKRLVRTMYDLQDLRLRTEGRIRTEENQAEIIYLVNEKTSDIENYLTKEIGKSVKLFPVWDGFLKDVKGCGPVRGRKP